jgi:Zn-dependent protease with chaperone function
MRKIIAAAFAGALSLVIFPAGQAQLLATQPMGPELYVQVRMETTGEATVNAWSRAGSWNLAPLLPQVLHCDGDLTTEAGGSAIRCSRALKRNGIALEGLLDLRPIVQDIHGSSSIELFVSYPRLGFDSSSAAMTEQGNGPRVSRIARFAAGTAPAPIRIRFGYRPDQLAGIYLPLLALALALTLIATIMSRAGFAPLALSAILLSTIVWMGATAQLEADSPLRILLFGTPLANFAALFVNLWPPLLCVASGVALGSRLRSSPVHSAKFGQIFSACAIVPLILTSVVGALPHLNRSDWFVAVGWLAIAPIFLLLRRAWNRARARSSIRQLTTGELKERVSALAARAGCPQVKLYISFSRHSQLANAFALPGRTIFLTAPLVHLLSKREVDAVAAHELSHARHSNRSLWTALCIAMVLCETPAREIAYLLPGGLLAAMIFPIAMYFVALQGSRKREFAADANAAALTGDPRAMISSLARIARNNDSPLDMNAIVERFSSHPSTLRRIGALAAPARLQAAEVDSLCAGDDQGEHYEIPVEEGGRELFTPAWQRTNAGVYGWLVIFGSCGAGLLVAWLLERFAGFGIAQILGGIVLGCALTKSASAAAMSRSYARLRRKLVAKLGVDGQIVGFAPDSEARIYGSYRFSDAGLLRFENGRLCYQSERIAIAINPVDVVEVSMVAAAPSNWFRRQPMVRFRDPESGRALGFILHTVSWLATQRRLLRSIERWRARDTSPESTSIKGFNPVAGQTFRNPTIAQVARGFLVTGGIALAAAIATCGIFRFDWHYVVVALTVTGFSYTSMLLPAMMYRPPSLPSGQTSSVETN